MSPQLTLGTSPKCYWCSRIDCSTFFLPSIISLNGINLPLLRLLQLTQHPWVIKYVFIPYNFIAVNGLVFSCCYEVLTTVLSDGHRNGRGGKNEDSNSHFCVGWDGVAKHITKCSSYHHEILSAEEKSLVITTWNCSLRRPGTSRERLTKSPLMNHICQITPWLPVPLTTVVCTAQRQALHDLSLCDLFPVFSRFTKLHVNTFMSGMEERNFVWLDSWSKKKSNWN